MDNPSFNQNGIEYNGEQIAYKDSTYELVSKVAYLIGVPLRIFQNEHEPPKIEIYKRRGDQRYIAAGVYQGNDERGCEKRNRAVRVYFMYRTFRYGNPMIDHDRRYCPHRGGKKTEQKTP